MGVCEHVSNAVCNTEQGARCYRGSSVLRTRPIHSTQGKLYTITTLEH